MVIRGSLNAGLLGQPPAALSPRQTREEGGMRGVVTRSGPGVRLASCRRRAHGFLTTELVVAMAILVVAMIPLSYGVLRERQLSRALYYRALTTEIVDGEIEILRGGEWSVFREGSNPYPTRAESATNLPPGRFVLTREARRLRLEWVPEKRGKGGRVAREVTLP